MHWDTFVTAGIPIATRDRPPGVQETVFQATAATLIVATISLAVCLQPLRHTGACDEAVRLIRRNILQQVLVEALG